MVDGFLFVMELIGMTHRTKVGMSGLLLRTQRHAPFFYGGLYVAGDTVYVAITEVN